MTNLTGKNIALVHQRSREWGLALTEAQLGLIDEYISSLKHYSKSLNLISRADIDHVFELHIFDSLEVLAAINHFVSEWDWNKKQDIKLLDVGSGAGLPGIPLAIALAKACVDLIEKSSKKCLFLQSVITKLELKNAKVINLSLEEYARNQVIDYDFILCRAVKSFQECAKLSAGFIDRGAKLIYFSRRSGRLSERFRVYPQKR